MIYGSVCSGIEAATVAWKPLGWQPKFFAEIEPFCCTLLTHYYPETKNYGDFTTLQADAGPIDLLVGGTPCQSFSVAGRRAGLDDPRGNLTLEFLGLVGRIRPRWLVWENVPGVLSIDGGRMFGTFLGALGELRYGFAYRILNAEHFGVPQRRRRVFVVGYFGDWRRAAAVLFERHCLSGHPAPSREAGKETAGTIKSGSGERGWALDTDRMTFVPDTAHSLTGRCGERHDPTVENFTVHQNTGHGCWRESEVAGSLGAANGRQQYESNVIAHALRADGFDASEDGTGRGTPLVPIAINDSVTPKFSDVGFTLTQPSPSGGGRPKAVMHNGVRRLLPAECEALQGFPRGYTAIPYRGKPAADGPRYRALGNSMAVPVMRWIGERLAMVEEFAQ